eukprot:m.173513 g.173513  ORF g.173513 m.173513 type:complete len:132 (+) comp18303_c0_seq4:77-472(+)
MCLLARSVHRLPSHMEAGTTQRVMQSVVQLIMHLPLSVTAKLVRIVQWTGLFPQFLAHIGVTPPPKQLLIILGSVAKIYAGELVEEARDEMLRRGENTAIQPRHLRLAARKLKAQGKIPSSENTHPTKFRR